MKPGTPGFIGERLYEARTARRMTAPTLADILGISRAAISQYENNQATPNPEVMSRIALVLNVPHSYFLTQYERSEAMVFFRSQTATIRMARESAKMRLNWLSQVVMPLQEQMRFPPVKIPSFTIPSDPSLIDQPLIEKAATYTRRFWGMGDGPISNVVWLLENNGAIITRGEIEEPYMDSFCRFGPDEGAPLIYLNADKSSAVRSRFDAAHELGHIILHRHIPEGYWSNESRIAMRERQAHKFAGAFLLPAKTFSADVMVPMLEGFVPLKRKWLVAIQAMLVRCMDIGLISEDHSNRLWRSLSRRGWRIHEPLDDELIPERPKLLPKAIELLKERNGLALVDFVRNVGLAAFDVAQLTMLPVSTFEEPSSPDILLFPSSY